MGNETVAKEKSFLHPRNRNNQRYDLEAMKASNPELKDYIKINKAGNESIDFSNPDAVRVLNKSILMHDYGIKYWDFPKKNLCPPIPGRADYIHHVADLLGESNNNVPPKGADVTCLDVGIGASCIYPIIGVIEYDWNFIGVDVDPKSIASSEDIISNNPSLKDKVKCILQSDPNHIFKGVIDEQAKINVSICNPPFHASKEEAAKSANRKVKNLTGKKQKKPKLNFSGISNELIYEGGEFKFISNMITESKEFSENINWFTTFVSKETNLTKFRRMLDEIKPAEVKVIDTATGNKKSRILAWTYKS